jgi:hypothetical protein
VHGHVVAIAQQVMLGGSSQAMVNIEQTVALWLLIVIIAVNSDS